MTSTSALLRRVLLSGAVVSLCAGFTITPSHAQQPTTPVTTSILDSDVIPRTPERLARGKYLVEGLLWCQLCHSYNDYSTRPAHFKEGTEFGGHPFPREEFDLPEGYQVVAPNISSDPEFGAGTWKDSDFVRALRRGIGHDGRTLFPMMPYARFRELPDEDLAAIIVYVRSQKPVHIQRPKTVLPAAMMKGVEPFPMPGHIAPPSKADRAEYGKYLVKAARCDECHSPGLFEDQPIKGMDYGGGETFDGPFGENGATVHVAALNLTSDPSGIPYFDETMFIKAMRNGAIGARDLTTVMPWSVFRNLNDEDLGAIFTYLRTLPPIKHHVDNTEPATFCKQCGNKHGLGCLNEGDKVETPAP